MKASIDTTDKFSYLADAPHGAKEGDYSVDVYGYFPKEEPRDVVHKIVDDLTDKMRDATHRQIDLIMEARALKAANEPPFFWEKFTCAQRRKPNRPQARRGWK